MIPQEQLQKIRFLLEQSSNPVFFFDNDVDGLAAFLILRKFCGKGKGVAIKSYPSLSEQYTRKLDEFHPDLIVVLDKPLISREFIAEAKQHNLKILWLDHHPRPAEADDECVMYFNPLLSEPRDNHPTAYWAYQVVKNKEYEWISMLGCIWDWYVPDFAKEFSELNPELFPYTSNSAKALYETQLGKITRTLDFALKDKTSAIVQMLKLMLEINTPSQINEENKKLYPIFKRYKQINKKYEKFLEKAKTIVSRNSKLLFFQYGGDLSLSSELANELFYTYPEKIVIVAYIKGEKVNCSFRGLINVRDLAKQALHGIESSSGGHENAAGATFHFQDLKNFKRNLLYILSRMDRKTLT
ncbi:MAG: DHHA1 domain-containing protein [Candidatus Pacearchaeota archaeon]|nr:DHHA1 domain-containing protein [Candidatus Pacearchaeota archaeon]